MTRKYDVGYARPPKASQFRPGQSGNPAGRKKGSRNIGTMVQAALDEKVVITLNGQKKTVSKLEAAFIQQSNRAAGGDPKAVKRMLDVLVGSQAREAGAADGAPDEKRQRNARIMEALKARFLDDGGDDGSED